MTARIHGVTFYRRAFTASELQITRPGFIMSDVEDVSALIGDIYDASLDPALWQSVFDKVAAFVGVAQANLFSHDNVRKSAELFFVSAHDPRYREMYFETYFRINPIFPTVAFCELEKPLTIPDVADLYRPLIEHPRVMRVVALSGGYSRPDACKRLSANHGMIASFSRALIDELKQSMSDAEFDAKLAEAVEEIYQASVVKV